MDRSTPNTVTVKADGRAETLRLRLAGLAVLSGDARGQVAELEETPFLIGSSEECDLVLPDPTVSARHAEIGLREEGYLLRDLGSRNGLYVGNWRVVGAYIAPGMRLSLGETELEVRDLQRVKEVALSGAKRFGRLVGRSAAMRRVFAVLESVAASDATVLLEGETGTGKTAVAEALHETGPLAGGPLEVFDCSAVAPTLLESELFGHEKGAFTNAITARAGALERANGGTLFLDEIGELPLELQPKLLRAVETGTFNRVGGAARSSRFRLIAATNRNLQQEVRRGAFRQDLYYRLAVVSLRIPPLRERLDDLPLLVEKLAAGLSSEPEMVVQRLRILTPLLSNYRWPGNVRELRNVVERVAVLEPDLALPTAIRPNADLSAGGVIPFAEMRELALEQFEKSYVRSVLQVTEGNVTQAAKEAGLSRRHLTRLIARHQIDRQAMD